MVDGRRSIDRGREAGSEGWAALCCAIQTPLEPTRDAGIAAITVRVPRVREALLDVAIIRGAAVTPPVPIRGIDAPPAPRRAQPLRGTLVALELDSPALSEKRAVTIYVPPDIPPGRRLPVIYLADGNTEGFAPVAEAAVREGGRRLR